MREARTKNNPRAKELFGNWERMLNGPFRGITTDGDVIPDLYAPRPEGAPTLAMIEAVNALLAADVAGTEKVVVLSGRIPTCGGTGRTPSFIVEHYGLRLDEIGEPLRDAVLAVLRASMSPHGYELSRDVMKLNRFLGDIVHGPAVMGEWSYIFCLFGEPSATEPWGWQFFGHHLVLNCFVLGQQMVLTPAFWGAEPSYADHGPFKGIRLFQDEERAGLKLMRAFSPEQQKRAIVAHSMMGGDLPEGRRHFADNLHLGGAFQDNRVVPYEGLKGDALIGHAAPRPDGPGREISRRAARRPARGAHRRGRAASAGHAFLLDRRVHARTSPFYYRVQSPVTFIEFDHHAGVFLTNPEPAKFHVHTIVRTPNGNDYGFDLLRQHYKTSPHHRQMQEQQQQQAQHRTATATTIITVTARTGMTTIMATAITTTITTMRSAESDFASRPHPEEAAQARRLEGWAAISRWPSFETHRFAMLLG